VTDDIFRVLKPMFREEKGSAAIRQGGRSAGPARYEGRKTPA
jgi:hypothetical protein